MAKIYWRKYKDKVENGEMTVDEVINLVPERWKDEVRNLFEANWDYDAFGTFDIMHRKYVTMKEIRARP